MPCHPYLAIPCNAIQCPSLPSLPGALLRSPRYLTSITRPALCIPRATRCNNLGQFPAEVPSADVLAYQGLDRGSIPNNLIYVEDAIAEYYFRWKKFGSQLIWLIFSLNWIILRKHRKNCKCCPVTLLIVRSQR